MNSDNYICGMKNYFIMCVCVCVFVHIVTFIYTHCGLGPGVFDLQQIVCYVFLYGYNYSCYVVRLFGDKWFLPLKGSRLVP